MNGKNRIVPAAGNVFATVHLEQAAESLDKYDWLESLVFDAQDRSYHPMFASVIRSESGTQGFLGRTTREVDPTQVHILFEIPRGTALERINVSRSIQLAPPRQ